jgi:feruloyl-CoA synthase
MRIAALAVASPVLQDAVVCGHDKHEVGVLAWPNLAACKEICRHAAHHGDIAELVRCPDIISHVRQGLLRHNRANPGSSTQITRVFLMTEPPSIDANEITDKGYINQRAVLERRSALTEMMFTDPAPDDVIVLG